MTLRTRVIAGLIFVALVVFSTGYTILSFQNQYLYKEVDQQLANIGDNANRIAKRLQEPLGSSRGRLISLGDVYLGISQSPNKGAPDFITLSTPLDDVELLPKLSDLSIEDAPRNVASLRGNAKHVRVDIFAVNNGRKLAVGISTTGIENTIGRLNRALIIGGALLLSSLVLLAWWIIRLGIRPIRVMTRKAEEIARGSETTRLNVLDGKTEAAHLGKALNHLLDSLKSNEVQMKTFIADASHELRTPLTTLMGYSSLYKSGGLVKAEALEDAMRRINNEALRMSRIIDAFLDLANMENHIEIGYEKCDISSLVQDLASDLRVVYPDITIAVDAPTPVTVECNKDHITQAILALCSNAVSHNSEETSVSLAVKTLGSEVRIEVRDTGGGIESHHLPHLFDRLYRVEKNRSSAAKHNGLGLAIVATIVSQHGGQYGVVSTPLIGSTFWFNLPLHQRVAWH